MSYLLIVIYVKAYQRANFSSITCNYVVSVRRGFLFLLVLWIGCFLYSLCISYIYFRIKVV